MNTRDKPSYLKAQLGLEQTILRETISATIRVVESVVGTHDGPSTSLDSILEWPRSHLVRTQRKNAEQ